MANPLITRRVQMLEGFLDSYAERENAQLCDSKLTLSNRYVPNRYDCNYQFSHSVGFGFRARLYWTKESTEPTPYLQVELKIARIPEHSTCEFFEYLLDLNHDFHDPIKLGVLDKHFAALFLRGRVDKVAPDYFESLIRDLAPLGNELLYKLQNRFGSRIQISESNKPAEVTPISANASPDNLAAFARKS